MLIKDACEQFLLYSRCTKDLSPHTIKAYERDLETFVVITGRNTPIKDYDRNKLREYVNELFAIKLSKATVKRRLAT